MRLAGREISQHGKPTTVFVVTDAEDGSIPTMLNKVEQVEAWFSGVKIYLNATTPRLIGGAPPQPATAGERNLAKLAWHFNGEFGSQRNQP